MSSIEEIESAIQKLPSDEYQRLRNWLIEYDNKIWDEEMDQDASSGRLAAHASEALDDLKEGKAKDL